jgi:membrane-associated phospholipid phosphatase
MISLVHVRRAVSLLWIAGQFALPAPRQDTLAIERTGDALQIVLPAAAGIASLALRDYAGTRQFVYALLASQGGTHTIKHIVNRKRPDGGRYSLPSAHTSAAFLGSGFVHRRWGFKYAWPLHLAAAFVGYSRVVTGKHWVTDVLAGAALSLLAVWLLVRPRNGKSRKIKKSVNVGLQAVLFLTMLL